MRRSIARATWEMQLVFGGHLAGPIETIYVNEELGFLPQLPLLCA